MQGRKRFHFMHIPKAGGISLSHFLDQQFKTDEICPSYFLYRSPSWANQEHLFKNLGQEKIQKYFLFRGHLGWIPRLYFPMEEIESIVFLRHPLERLLSEYDHISRDIVSFPFLSKQWSSFDDFLKTLAQKNITNMQTRYFCSDLYFKSDFTFESIDNISDEYIYLLPFGQQKDIPLDQLLNLAIERIHDCAFIGITEQFDKSFDLLCQQFRWLPPNKKSKLNAAPKRTKIDDLSPKALDLAIELNQLDIILYQEALKIIEDKSRTRIVMNREQHKINIIESLPVSDIVDFSFDNRIIGEGWHLREGDSPNVFCWTSDNQSSLVFSIRQLDDMLISFHVINSVVAEFQNKISLIVNQHPVALIHYPHPQDGFVFEGIILKSFFHQNHSLIELCFSLSETARPCDISQSTDKRALGFACKSVTIKPIKLLTTSLPMKDLIDSGSFIQPNDENTA